jgi:hypothetical protein
MERQGRSQQEKNVAEMNKKRKTKSLWDGGFEEGRESSRRDAGGLQEMI